MHNGFNVILWTSTDICYASLCMTISDERTKQLDIFCHVTGFTSDFRLPQIYALGMAISGERTEQHIVIGFGELAAVN